MFQAGDRVMYGIHGACNVIGLETQILDKKEVIYLILEPITQLGSRYLIPTHNAVAMGKVKRILTREELERLFSSEDVRETEWIQDESVRKQTYRELISSGDRKRLMSMVHTLYQHKAKQAAAGRKVHLCDDNFLRDAEKLLASEVAFVMEITQDQAKQFIRQKLK